ncbi:hypothetical protein Jiend_48600 [Micromonospora endophytica]|nr:hypothetical protein Jiend_48600 [Micromonospora endophytica]
MRLSELRGRTVAVWGAGREGRAAVIAIAAHGPADLVAVDDSANFLTLPWEGPLAEAAPLVTGEEGFARLAAAEVVVRSPGVPQTHPWLVELRHRGVTVTQGTALWMADHGDRTVGVTGSKGKSTTSSLISHLLAAVDRPNVFGGNIGVPTLDLPEAELYVLELSSYQCSDLTDSPRVAVVTALFPEHLDAHGGEREYYRDKLNLLAYGPRTVVVNGADPRLLFELGDRAAVHAGTADSVNVAAGPDGTPWFHLVDRPLFPGRCCRSSAGTTRATSAWPWRCSTRSGWTWSTARTPWPWRWPSSRGWPTG